MFYLSMTPSFPIFRKFPFTKSTQRPLVLENELTEHAYFSNNPQHYFLLNSVADPGGAEGAMAPPWPCENRS